MTSGRTISTDKATNCYRGNRRHWPFFPQHSGIKPNERGAAQFIAHKQVRQCAARRLINMADKSKIKKEFRRFFKSIGKRIYGSFSWEIEKKKLRNFPVIFDFAVSSQ